MVPLTQTIQNPPIRRDVDGFSSSWDDADQNIDDTRRTRPFRNRFISCVKCNKNLPRLPGSLRVVYLTTEFSTYTLNRVPLFETATILDESE